ncbi:arginase family protein [Agromyces mediolanus]|uniref:arginase family protein n=1 Tax=Agromyces mediolanus TaxID=41986 RepID=UPI003832DF4E
MIALVAAPSSLGLRPPYPGAVPGAWRAPEALREAGLFDRLAAAAGARDAGTVPTAPYVDDDAVRPAGRVRNEAALVDHSRRLAQRIDEVLDAGDAPLVIGGDCSILLGAGLALARRGGTGLVHLDGHTDFRHPGNSDACASVAGEDLAAAVGLHWAAIADIDGAGPYFAAARTVHLGHRDDDEHAAEARRTLGLVVSAAEALGRPETLARAAAPGQLGAPGRPTAQLAERIRATAGTGYWLQLDVDLLDPSVMPAVDSPDPGGLDAATVTALLAELAPAAIGASVTVFDPELDPDGRYARLLADVVVEGLGGLGSALHR